MSNKKELNMEKLSEKELLEALINEMKAVNTNLSSMNKKLDSITKAVGRGEREVYGAYREYSFINVKRV